MAIESIFLILILVFSVILHEIAHGYMAEALGDSTARRSGRLTLNPLPHLDLWGSVIIPLILLMTNAGFLIGWAKPVPYNPYNLRNAWWGEALVAGAGPAMNIGIAFVFSILLRVNAGADFLPSSFVDLTASLVFINLLLAFFNLVPVPPLDGSKVLASFLPLHISRWLLPHAVVARFGLPFGFLLMFLFLFFLWPVFFAAVSWLFTLFTGVPLGV
ncbi:MAG: hypothetical protein A3D67_03365 [Candidatus Lloydbacteria bacterium RIFCSPHIGHO2_02_FULL_51_22]|uniref:Peptidase M50 domain-containing protein n=3 Tax=Candidatus Lloydiibacteriota TaxID=1817910 RepID=A0A1G2DEJ7_9BACT|nr:MAG: hypothetical protein A3D67_03365 [Candidatus Lloydbacteria bacterium RIFCSPHIGHO2_02_FULL_51_22]OGZ15825.1 MAG: hypothetical protein A3J08_03480 [Candidatus Lloydbacteria bacterium RIFCSPLOWO2_02_FULL_51_11]OGZ16139.1 MAG: hypothetical protein A3G11_00480 [Candidatus Lloydbacteria bacterium RIFCSPLOWO2_12_FULL_51_9]